MSEAMVKRPERVVPKVQSFTDLIMREVLQRDEEPEDVPAMGESGILCPWNRDDTGPAKLPLWCKVWKNMDDFNDWSGGQSHQFCRVHCKYGHNPEYMKRVRERLDRLRGKAPAWLKNMMTPPAFMQPARGRRL